MIPFVIKYRLYRLFSPHVIQLLFHNASLHISWVGSEVGVGSRLLTLAQICICICNGKFFILAKHASDNCKLKWKIVLLPPTLEKIGLV